MQTTQFPEYVLEQLNRFQREFICETTEAKRKIHLVNWDIVTRYKYEDGLEIQGMRYTNRARKAKLAWKCFIEKIKP